RQRARSGRLREIAHRGVADADLTLAQLTREIGNGDGRFGRFEAPQHSRQSLYLLRSRCGAADRRGRADQVAQQDRHSRAIGRRTVNVEPAPSWLVTVMKPP